MATQLNPQQIRNLGIYGVIREAELDTSLIPEGAVTEAINFSFDRKGSATLRTGIAAIGSTVSAGNSCIGLFNVQSATLLAVFNTSIFQRNTATSTWDAVVTGLTSGQNTRFVDFANRTIMVNGSYDSIRVWNGSNLAGWVTTGSPINPQQFASDANVNTQTLRAKYIESYKDRVYLTGDPTTPDRLFFSSVITSTGVITWTPSTDYIDINPNDGENITAIKRYSLELLLFKPNYIYRFKTSGVDPDPLIKLGTRSQESVVEGKRGLYFHHDSGIYRYTGGYPVEISRPISDVIDAIPYSQYSSIAGWKDSDHIYWWLGNLTINDPITENATWTSVVIRFTESSELWTIYSYATNLVRGSDYNTGSALSRVVGLSNGVVATLNSGNNDLGEPIKYRLITKWYEWEGISTRKVLQTIVALCVKAQGSLLMYQTDDDPNWHDLGQLRKFLNYFRPLSINFHRIRFKLTGVSNFEPLIFQGLEIPEGINEGLIN